MMEKCKSCGEDMVDRLWAPVGEPAECCPDCDGIDPEAERDPYVARMRQEKFERDVKRTMDRAEYGAAVQAEARKRLKEKAKANP